MEREGDGKRASQDGDGHGGAARGVANGGAPVLWRWQLVGQADVRRSPGCAEWRVRDLQAMAGRELGIAPRWLAVSLRSRRLESNEPLPDSAHTALLVSLVLPAFARACSEAGVPPTKRRRVTNQAAVAALAWQPGLLLHELPAEEEDGRGPAPPSYPVFVKDIPGFPAPLLRLDMQCEAPTVGTLVRKTLEVTGTDLRLVFGQQTLRAGRQYLRRLGIVAGSVVAVSISCPPSPVSPCARDSSAATPLISSAVDVDELQARCYGATDQTESGGPVGRVVLRPLLLPAGALFAGSSRKRNLSTGQSGPRGPGGIPSLLAARPGALIHERAQADSVESPSDRCGGFVQNAEA
jgi:hypothetical protein